MKWRERAVKDALIGFATGDALGVPVEYTERSFLEQHPVTQMKGYGTYRQPPGTWSDETSLMLATMDSITQMGQIHLDDMMTRYLAWLDEKAYLPYHEVFDLTTGTHTALNNYRNGVAAYYAGGRSDFNNSNSGMTRLLPLAFYFESDAFTQVISDAPHRSLDLLSVELIHQVSCLTNGHYVALVCASVYTYFARWLVRWRLDGGVPGSLRPEDLINPLRQVLDGLEQLYLQSDYSLMVGPLGNLVSSSHEERDGFENAFALLERLRNPERFRKLPQHRIMSDGYCLHSLETIFYCLLNYDSYEEAVLAAVNLGSDTDTHGALVGGLAGLLYGQEMIPKEWQSDLARTDELERHAQIAGITFFRPELREAFMLIPWLEHIGPMDLPRTLNREVFYPLSGPGDLFLDWSGVELHLHDLINQCSLTLEGADLELVEDRVRILRYTRSDGEQRLPNHAFYAASEMHETGHTGRLRALADLIYLLEDSKLRKYILREDSECEDERPLYVRLLLETLLRIRKLYHQQLWFDLPLKRRSVSDGRMAS